LNECDIRRARATMERRGLFSRLAFLPLFAGAAANKIQIYACGACSRARGVTEAHLTQWGARFGNPMIFISVVEWADRIITE
jgi:sulfur relay (sulfurtransferase) complex TusBCD TusD component (DsrE family)